MKSHPILFSAPMIRALLAGKKTVTRRMSKQWLNVKAGDELWCRETWKHRTDGLALGAWYRADGHIDIPGWPWKPSIFMPRKYSRITLEATEDARLERLQDITEEDAIAEGVEPWPHNPLQPMTSGEMGAESPYRGGYACLWDDINDEVATWKSNPKVVRLAFKVKT